MPTNHAAWLRGGFTFCDVPPPNVLHPWRLVLLGAPGVGKGTQAEMLHERLGACHLSTGDIFRAAKAIPESDRSPAMTAALNDMHRGELVTDATVLAIVRERTRCLKCRGGFLLDGFPRTVAQAEALRVTLNELGVTLDAVLSYELGQEEIVARLVGRRTCAKCHAIYRVTGRPPRIAGVCDKCGGELGQRDDDRPASVRVRLAAYEKDTKPLVAYYRQCGLLVPLSTADGGAAGTYARTMAALKISI